jgi:metal-responsive CopG/Arc/MetJ family transcriptional regulator
MMKPAQTDREVETVLPNVSTRLPLALLARIDEFRLANFCATRSEALRRIVAEHLADKRGAA